MINKKRMSMLVHICCSVDSHYFLQKLQDDFPDEKLTGFFYDPNIHPYAEYRLRFEDVKHSCEILGIELIEGEYDLDTWLSLVKGLENEPEKGDRCTVCFDRRLDVSVNKAKELGHTSFTTSLLISPKKSQEKLDKIGNDLESKSGLQWVFKDYRAGQGVQIQGEEVKENQLYRQNYCGCLFGLTQQRDGQDKLLDEMISPIAGGILPESIEERLELYRQRNRLKKEQKEFRIIKQRFLNYRELSGKTLLQKEVIPSYFLCYSTLKNNKTNGRVEYTIDDIHYLNRDEVKLITIEKFNLLAHTSYKNVMDLYSSPLLFEDELQIRNTITHNPFDLSCIVVVDSILDGKYEILLNSKVYDDVKEKIIEI
jgi:predicted adenine nucleotide alpha hydrolase (AANH) superfamily ATPase